MSATPSIDAAGAVERLVCPESSDFPVSTAKAILELRFDERDRERMHDLAVRNQRGILTSDESRELDMYVNLGLLIDILRAKARLSLKRADE